MIVVLFWIKIIFNRFMILLRASPLIIVWIFIVAAAFVYAVYNRYLSISLDSLTLLIIIPLFLVFSILKSLKVYDLIPLFIKYSKSRLNNKIIAARFFVKQAFLNNLLLFIFSVIIYFSAMNNVYFFITLGSALFSLILSYITIKLNNKYANRKSTGVTVKKPKINTLVKSALYDYINPDFLSMFIVCIAAFFVIIFEFTKDMEFLYETHNQLLFFMIMTVIFSIGFIGIIESIYRINWKFQAILSPNNFKYHIKRTMIFLAGVYGWLFAIFIVIGILINPVLLIKHLLCILTIFLFTICLAFTISGRISKLIVNSIMITLTVYLGILPAGFLVILIIPVIILWLKARNEYRQWSFL